MPVSWSQTKAGRAHALRATVAKGPSFDMTFLDIETGLRLDREQRLKIEAHVAARYKLWMETWVMPELSALTASPAKKEG